MSTTTDTSANSAGGAAAAKPDSTASAKAAARRKQQQQQKSQKANVPPPAKKKQPTVIKPAFDGIATGAMKGICVAQGDGNLAGQFRLFQKKLAGAAAEDKAYGLDSAILNLIAKNRSDFIKPKPDPLVHSHLIDVMEKDDKGNPTTSPTGEKKLQCFDPVLKEEMDAEYNMDLKFQSSNWNQYGRHQEGYFRTAMGNIDSDVLTYCRMDSRMKIAEDTTDLVMLLLVLRSVCAQNHGAVKVDEEYHNLGSVHAAVCFRQKKSVSNAAYADEVLDRYESSIFTSGKFVFGQAVYDSVLSDLPTPKTFKQYIFMSNDEQSVIDNIVKERTVARLIIKNSLNNRARNELSETYSVTNDKCYPNSISEALSLLATFKSAPNNNPSSNGTSNPVPGEDAVVSYHETNEHDAHDTTTKDEANHHDNANKDVVINPHVSFEATVMAAIVAEATAEEDSDQFFGASFAQLQDVADAYEDNEPDIVVSAHVVDNNDAPDPEYVPDFVNEANNNATENNARVRSHTATITGFPVPAKDFELMVYHTAQRVMMKASTNVYVYNYDLDRPDLISHHYDNPVPESIIDYSDALRFKLKCIGIHNVDDLNTILSNKTDIVAMTYLKNKLNSLGLKGILVDTIKILRKETIRSLDHGRHNSLRYHTMNMEIGTDAMMETFPPDNTLLHHVVSAVAINQSRRKPNRWVNKITHKLIDAGITSIQQLESKLDSNSLNNHLAELNMPTLHAITIMGFIRILGTADFRQGRS
jgi:hypothetical protein